MKSSLLGRATRCFLVAALAAIAVPIGVGGFVATAHAQSQQALPADFRVALEPYGKWLSHARWGEVWVPSVPADWQPYSQGHWAYTEEWGWYWVADEEWGWIPYHYGRWIFDRELGWAWVPGREWAPAWVQWRQGTEGTDVVGWAPLPPDEIAYDAETAPDPSVWVFCPLHALAAPRIAAVIVPRRERGRYYRDSVLVNRTMRLDRVRIAVNPGVPPSYIATATGRPLRAVEVRPRVIPGTVGVRGGIVTRVERPQRTAIRETIIDRSASTIPPATSIPPAQPLALGERGRLGDQPPRAVGGQPTQPSAPAIAPPRATEGRTPPTIVRPGQPSVTSPSVTPQPQRPSAAPPPAPQRPPAAERIPPQQRIAPSQPSRPTPPAAIAPRPTPPPAATAPRPSAPPAATAPRPSPPPAVTAPRVSPPATSGQAPAVSAPPRPAPSAPAQPLKR